VGGWGANPLPPHKAAHEAKVAAEVIAGDDVRWDARSIPNVAYTDPEIAWTGLTETQARAEGSAYEKASFPWAAAGRSLAQGRDDGLTKLLVEPETRRLLGAGVVGPNAGELIAEAVHAIEVGSDAQDLGLTVHPHPTLSETLGFAAEMADGTITDLMPPRARRTSTPAAR
jgi:dihydrolipoamide dehydrogenase